MKNAIALDSLREQTNEGQDHNNVRLSDGKDLVNLVLGRQDKGFTKYRDTIQFKIDSKPPNPESVIKESLVGESETSSLCTSEELGNCSDNEDMLKSQSID